MLSSLRYLYGAVAIYFIVYCFFGRRRMRREFRMLSRVCFAVYLMIALYITLFSRTPSEERSYNFSLFWTYRCALAEGALDLYYEAILNIALFIPFGILIHASCRKWNRYAYLYRILIPAAVFSSGIEVSQYLFRLGLCELDDIVHNMLGALIGSGIYLAFRGIVWKKDQVIVYVRRIFWGLAPLFAVSAALFLFGQWMRH